MTPNRLIAALVATGTLAFGVAACGGDDNDSADSGSKSSLSGAISIDGSSTVGPFIQAAAEAFNKENPDVDVTVGQSGTGGGFEKFCKSETDISTASRPIKDEETEACKTGGVTTSELVVANDGIAVVANPELAVKCLTVEQLSTLWKDDSATDYSDTGVDGFSGKVSLYGPGTDSGTFDFFTDVINGEEGVSRKKYSASEDDNVLVQGIQGDKSGLGYFGFSYYEQNADSLKLVEIDGGKGCVAPSAETIQDGTYTPLSRELYIYPSAKAVERPEVKAFLEFVNAEAASIAETSLFVPLTTEQQEKAKGELAEIEGGEAASTPGT